LLAFLQENNFRVKIHPVMPCGRADGRGDYIQVYDNYVDLLIELCEKGMELKVEIDPIDAIMKAMLGNSKMRECSFNGNCAVSFLCLYADGTVGFCGRGGSIGNLSYGNLENNDISALYYSSNAEKIRARQEYLLAHDCKDCKYWRFCHGGCSFEAVNILAR